MSTLRDFLDGLFPMECVGCGGEGGSWAFPFLCASCGDLVPHHVWPSRTAIPCVWGTYSLFSYEGLGGHLIRAGKYGLREDLLAALASHLATVAWADVSPFDCVVPAPSPWRRVVSRGFSAPGMMAASVGRASRTPVVNALRRLPGTRQAGLARDQRWSNAWRKVLLVESEMDRIGGRNVLLVDDVVTTGATAAACAQALLEGGALRVELLTLASALP